MVGDPLVGDHEFLPHGGKQDRFRGRLVFASQVPEHPQLGRHHLTDLPAHEDHAVTQG